MKYIKIIVVSVIGLIVFIALVGMSKFNVLANLDGFDADGNYIDTE